MDPSKGTPAQLQVADSAAHDINENINNTEILIG
jgi:hypothetical protein